MNLSTHNPNDPIENLAIGKIIEVDGSHIVAELSPNLSELSRVYAGETYPIGQFGSIIRIHFGRRLVYAFVGRLRMKSEFQAERGLVPTSSSDERIIEADLFAEGEWINKKADWDLDFERGVSTYPLPQQTVYLTPKAELRSIYGKGQGAVIELGQHVGSRGTPCLADLNELLGKHTAVLGSTGTGKSGTVAAIVHSILERGEAKQYKKWKPRIIILDPHGEYSSAFTEKARLSPDDGTLNLPYWLLNFQETVTLLIGKTEFVATSQANIIKSALLSAREEGAQQLNLDTNGITIDSPIPYKLSTLENKIEKDSEKLTPSKREPHNSILHKLEILMADARFRFMMEEWNGDNHDPFPAVIKQLAGDGPQPRIIDLSGIPNEIAGISSASVARTLFSLKIWQTQSERESDPVLLVCEEAHRYVPNRGEAQYEAAQEAIRRIAKEGRKYGVGLLLVSQRPSEVESTVLSQCNSWIILRITNEEDRAHVRSILPDSMSGLTKMLSGLRRQEAIFVGQATMLPSRILIRSLTPEQLPKSNDVNFDDGWQNDAITDEQIKEIAHRWRYQRQESVK